jgi:hypothetical protein
MSRRFAVGFTLGSLAVAALGFSPLGDAAQRLVLPPNSVGSAQLRIGAVTGAKVKDASLTRRDFAAGQIPAGPAGAPGPAGPAGPAGPPGLSGLQFVGGESSYDSTTPRTASVLCPAGKRALAWSWHIELASSANAANAPGLTELNPIDADVASGRLPGGYSAKAEEFGSYPDNWKLFVYVTCATV